MDRQALEFPRLEYRMRDAGRTVAQAMLLEGIRTVSIKSQ